MRQDKVKMASLTSVLANVSLILLLMGVSLSVVMYLTSSLPTWLHVVIGIVLFLMSGFVEEKLLSGRVNTFVWKLWGLPLKQEKTK
jgi:hypothetical protein